MSRRRRKVEESSGGSAQWLTTYSDMVTLLLCFFVLLFSFSNIDAEKFRSIMSSFRGGTGVLSGGTSLDIPFNLTEDDLDVEIELEELLAQLEEYTNTLGLGDRIIIQPEERGLVIRFMDNVFFDSGSAEIKEEAFEILDSVAEILNREEFKNRHIKVEGHTDTDPIVRASRYETNWELSAARATNVLRYLVEVGSIDGNRISSSGYAYYRNIAPNDTPENKAKNRRVDIVILKDDFEKLEP
ncbi:MAG: flagellar motor protein MotB [Tissierellia bacterium]|nr:flagellar motor protein MotB [Tissierellia bacterium]